MPRINTSLLALAAVVLMSACSETISRLSGEAPEAEAGVAQVVDFDSSVQLNGSASYDNDGGQLTYLWQQIGGDSVILLSDSDAVVQFTAPAQDSDLTFRLTVTDTSGQQDSDSTTVYVRNIPSVEIILDTDVVSEADASLGVRFLLSRSTNSSGTINLGFGGSADYDADYYLAKSILIPAETSAYDTAIDIYDNELAEGDKTISVSITDATQFDFDPNLIYSITISEDDTAPEFTSSTEHEADDQRTDTDYRASATDIDGDDLNYSIVGGSDIAAFSIDHVSGSLSFDGDYFNDFYAGLSDVPLYDDPADSDSNNIYDLILRVSDGHNYSEQNLTILLAQNDNLSAPLISTSNTTSVNEGSTVVFYTARADDLEDNGLTWAISGEDSTYLAINASGQLSFILAMDYENPLDAEPRARDNVYEINLSVSDGRFSDWQDLNISVLDVAEDAPELSVTNVASDSLTLSWEEIGGSISYHIYQTIDSDCFLSSNDSVPVCAEIDYRVEASSIDSNTINLPIDSLDSYTEYFFVMVAESEVSYSDLSPILQVTTTVTPPSDASFIALSNSEIYLSWSDVDNADSYNLHRYSNEDCDIDNFLTCSDYHYESDIAATEYTDSGLDRAITYYYQLESIGENNIASEPSQQYSQATAAYHIYNDSGITYSGLYSSEDSDICEAVGEDASINAEQDCHHGRDADYADGEFTKIGDGVAAFDFTKLASDGTVLEIQDQAWSDDGEEIIGTSWSCVHDNTTDLTWEIDSSNNGPFLWGGSGALSGGSGTYHDDWTDTINDANSNTLCGLSDWRVPTVDEILDLSYLHKDSAPHIDSDYFPNTNITDQYWTALPRGDKALAFSQASATPAALDTNSSVYVRLVSGVIRGDHWEDSRYHDNVDGTVTDLATNLMWAKCSGGLDYDAGACQGSSSSVHWKDALEAAGASELAGYDDWRLPNAKELQTLSALSADGSSGVNTVFILGEDVSRYLHSSTPDPEDDGNSYRLDLDSGLLTSLIRTSSFGNYLLVRSSN